MKQEERGLAARRRPGIIAGCLIAAGLAAGWGTAAVARTTLPVYDVPGLQKACDQGLSDARRLVTELEAIPLNKVTVANTLAGWNRLTIVQEDVSGPVDLIANVSPDKAVREAAEACLLKYTALSTELFQNEKLFQRLQKLATKDPIDRKYRKDLLDQFEDAGVALAPEKRARVKAIFQRLEELRQEFDRNVRDDKSKLSFTPDEVMGLPASYLEKARKDGKVDAAGNYLLGFEYPEYNPFMESAVNEEARRRYQFAFNNRGGQRNLDLLGENIKLRKELAELFGLPSFAHYATRRRMVENPATVDKFLNEVKAAVREVEQKELEELRALKAKLTGTPVAQAKVNRWDATFLQETLRKERYAVDQESLRQFFPTEASLQWTLHLASTLYGVRFEEAKVPVWHEDVRYFDVIDLKSGKPISGVYIDLFPRPAKYGHAAVWPVRAVSTLARRTPISVLVTNFDRNGLSHNEIETLLHEFGHALHGVLSHTRYAGQGGTTVERDFVEAPSQMFEEWATTAETLKLVPKFCQPACPTIDDATIKRLNAAKSFGQGIRYARQHLYASFDMALYQPAVVDPQSVWAKMEGETPLGHVDGTKFAAAFSHIVSGYAAGYYGYMWSKVLALDMYSKFGNTLLNPEIGHRFRAKVLGRGSEVPARQMVRDFLGREPSNQAFFADITGKR